MRKTNLLILFAWICFVGMERFNHPSVDILDGLLHVGRVQTMRNLTVLKINGLIFAMDHNGPSLCTLEKCKFFIESPSPHPHWNFCFQGEIYHVIVKIMCNCQLQNLHYYYPNMSICSPRRLTNSPDPRRSCH